METSARTGCFHARRAVLPDYREGDILEGRDDACLADHLGGAPPEPAKEKNDMLSRRPTAPYSSPAPELPSIALAEANRLLSEAAHALDNVGGLSDAERTELDVIDRLITNAGMRLSALSRKAE